MISVVIPVYRSAAILPLLHERLDAALKQLNRPYEILFVEDCGGDGSWEALQSLAALHPQTVCAIRLFRNFGQHAALLCGIRAARGSIIVTMDDDLQHPPETIHLLLKRLEDEKAPCDLVYGRPGRERQSLWRNAASQSVKWAMRVGLGVKNADQVSAYRAFRTYLRDAFADYKNATVNIDVLLTWGTTAIDAVHVDFAPRVHGSSGYTMLKLFGHAFNMITGFSTRPLRLASLVGMASALFGLAVLVYVIMRWLVAGSVVPGFAFLASLMAIFAGAQMFTVGILGEYMARVFVSAMNRPQYVVRQATKNDDQQNKGGA